MSVGFKRTFPSLWGSLSGMRGLGREPDSLRRAQGRPGDREFHYVPPTPFRVFGDCPTNRVPATTRPAARNGVVAGAGRLRSGSWSPVAAQATRPRDTSACGGVGEVRGGVLQCIAARL